MSIKNFLLGKHIINPDILSANVINCLLWTAQDLKFRMENGRCDVKDSKLCTIDKRITILYEDSATIFNRTLITSACHLLGLPLPNLLCDREWTKLPVDIGRFLSIHSDLVLVESHKQTDTEKLSRKSKVPIVNVSSCRYCIPKVLSDLMVIHEHFGYLEDVSVATIGVPCALLTTYLSVGPRLKMNIKYMCTRHEHTPISPYGLDKAMNYCKSTKATLTECHRLNDVLKDTHVIVIAKPDFDLIINEDQLKFANENCIVLPLISYGGCCDGNELLEMTRCKAWKAFEYGKWIYAALILSASSDWYEHTTEMPNLRKTTRDSLPRS